MDCWKCGRTLDFSGARKVSRNESCDHCDSDLHVCKNCRFHDPTYHNECRETQAEWVSDKERANFCDYFEPSQSGARTCRGSSAQNARTAFDQLFKD